MGLITSETVGARSVPTRIADSDVKRLRIEIDAVQQIIREPSETPEAITRRAVAASLDQALFMSGFDHQDKVTVADLRIMLKADF